MSLRIYTSIRSTVFWTVPTNKRICIQSQRTGHEQCCDHGPRSHVRCDRFYREARKQGIKPILGCEVYVAPNSRFDRETAGGESRYHHLVLLAETIRDMPI